jgi:hypothetical protein
VADSYLDFLESPNLTGKTRIVQVVSKRHGDALGVIRWFGRWRQYTFWPFAQTTFNPGCLTEINGRIGELMAERRVLRHTGGATSSRPNGAGPE